MREKVSRRSPFSIDVVLVAAIRGQLAALLSRSADGREKWMIPWGTPKPGEGLEGAALRIAQEAVGSIPVWIELSAAFGEGHRHPSDAEISVAYTGVVPAGSSLPAGSQHTWFPISELPAMSTRKRAIIDSALGTMRSRMDQVPIAFRLLPASFTLSELQQVYELLLGKKLHKASFRRALQAAFLVEATEEWRGEGRGRPAQLYRYAPRKKRRLVRGVRFDLLQP